MNEASIEGSNCLTSGTSGDYITTTTITEAVPVTEPPSTEPSSTDSPNEPENENPDTNTIDIFEASAWNYLQLAVELCFLGKCFKMLLYCS